jgi:hypothetical protein
MAAGRAQKCIVPRTARQDGPVATRQGLVAG